MHREHYGFLFGVLTAFLLSMNAIFIRWAGDIPITSIIFIRFFFALLCFLPFVFLGKVDLHFRNIRKHLIRAITGLLAMYGFYYSIRFLPLVDVMTFFNTSPLFLPLIVLVWLKLIVPKMRLLAVVIGFIGIIVILRPGSDLNIIGVSLALCGGFFSAIAQLGIRQLSKEESIETILTYYFLISTVFSFVPMVIYWEPIGSLALWGNLLLISITAVAFQYCLSKSLTHAPATKVASASYLNVVFGGLLGWWLFQEVPTIWSVLGSILIVIGGLIALFSKAQSRKWGQG